MQPEASRISPGDDRIIFALFREWVAARRHMSAVPDEEFEAACAGINGIKDTINETPSKRSTWPSDQELSLSPHRERPRRR